MMICPNCGKEFDNKTNCDGLRVFYEKKYCSMSCASKGRPKHHYVLVDGKRVKKEGQLKEGQKRIRPQGYIDVYTRGCFRPEHRIVFEKHLGRKLIKGEVIHHRDGNKQNNKIENLQLLSNVNHCFAVETKHSEDICKLLYKVERLEKEAGIK